MMQRNVHIEPACLTKASNQAAKAIDHPEKQKEANTYIYIDTQRVEREV